MSTYCTYDLAHLELRTTGRDSIWVSPWSASTYDKGGRVLTPPSKADLPYYELELSSGEYGGPRDTLYVKIGSEKAPEWRLVIPGLENSVDRSGVGNLSGQDGSVPSE